ncbi:MAG: XTP/dITP diphosphatase [Cellulosilyticaceae bacterium]
MKKIIFATQNKGKVKEIKELLKDLNMDIQTMDEAGINIEIEENGLTFEENAIIKASALREYGDAIILADDSGLEIDYLNKEPGVHSARYLGKDTPYEQKNKIIIERLEGVEKNKRSARFVCVIAACLPNGKNITTRGTVEGYIGYEARGENGFGYDPIFYVNDLDKTMAELTNEEKNSISHRGQALRDMKKQLRELVK